MEAQTNILKILFPKDDAITLEHYNFIIGFLEGRIDIVPFQQQKDRFGEVVTIYTNRDGNPTSTTSNKFYNIKFNLKDVMLDLFPQTLTIAKSHESPLALLLVAYNILRILSRNKSISINNQDADVLIAILQLTHEQDIITNDSILQYLSEKPQDEVLLSIDKLENIGCIKRTEQGIMLAEDINIRSQI